MPTSSADTGKPADPGEDLANQEDLPRAQVVREGAAGDGGARTRDPDALPLWVRAAGAGAVLLVGWGLILFYNNFNVTVPLLFVCLGYAAGVGAVYALFRTGASAVAAGPDDDDESSWGRPVGARAELEREKKALLKAIKEAEFDLQMGKLSKVDAEAMIARYRAQAIAVIRELDHKEGEAATAREQIEREVRARLEVAKAKKAAEVERKVVQGEKKPAAGKKGKKGAGTPQGAKAAEAKADEKAEQKAGEKTGEKDEPIIDRAAPAAAAAAAIEATAPEAAAPEAAAPEAASEAATEAAAPDEAAVLSDPADARGAGTTGAAKEATP